MNGFGMTIAFITGFYSKVVTIPTHAEWVTKRMEWKLGVRIRILSERYNGCTFLSFLGMTV